MPYITNNKIKATIREFFLIPQILLNISNLSNSKLAITANTIFDNLMEKGREKAKKMREN